MVFSNEETTRRKEVQLSYKTGFTKEEGLIFYYYLECFIQTTGT